MTRRRKEMEFINPSAASAYTGRFCL